MKVALGPTNVAGITASMIGCENGIGKALVAWQVLALPPLVPLPDSADSYTIPYWFCAVLRFLLATQPDQFGCVLDPVLMSPPFLGGRASFP